MSTELAIKKDELSEKINLFANTAEIANTNIPKMMQSVENAMAAMADITEITSDEQDVAVNNLLVRVKQTHENVQTLRKAITDPYDDVRKTLMLIEGEVDPKKGKDNGYNRLRSLREVRAQEKLDERRKEEEKIAQEKLINNKLIDLKMAIMKNIEIGPMNQITHADSQLAAWFDGLTLDNFDAMSKQLDEHNPNLKQELYDGWFVINLDLAGVPQEKIDEAVASLQKNSPYKIVNNYYKKKAQEKIDGWKKKLPEMKKRLEDIAKADGEEKEKLEAQLEAKKKIEKEQQDKKDKEEKKAAEQKIESDAKDDKLSESFVEQAGVQNLEEVTGTKKFVIRFSQEKWPKPFFEIVYHCVTHKDFSGIYAKNRDGSIKLDDKGREQYIPEIDKWMKFFASKCDAKIEGTKIFADAKVATRAKKK